MTIIMENNVWSFKFWGVADDKAKLFTYQEKEIIEQNLEELYPHGITETQLNDIFAYDTETLCEWVGIPEDELIERKYIEMITI